MSYVVDGIVAIRADFKCYTISQLGMFSRWYLNEPQAEPSTSFSLSDLGPKLNALFSAVLPDCMSVDATFSHIDIQAYGIVAGVVSDAPITDIYREDVNISGTITGDLLPTQCSGIISLRTGNPGRSGRGRNYIPFPGETSNDSTGLPNSTYVTALGLLAGAMTDNILIPAVAPDNILRPAIHSRVLGTLQTISVTLAEGKWATQRRRGAFGKPNTR